MKYLVSRQREEQKRHPERHRARRAVSLALQSGMLKRPRHCSKCRKPDKLHAHHPSYAKRNLLKVIWLCRPCHRIEHPPRGYRKKYRDIRAWTDPRRFSKTLLSFVCIHCKKKFETFYKRPRACPNCHTICWNRPKKTGAPELYTAEQIMERLEIHNWNFTKTAVDLGISYATIRRHGFWKWKQRPDSITRMVLGNNAGGKA